MAKSNREDRPETRLSPEEQRLHESRRRFLKQAVSLGVTIAAAQLLPPLRQAEALPPSAPVNTGGPFLWNGSAPIYSGIVNLANGNTLFSRNICSWGEGVTGVCFTVYFNSLSTATGGPLGAKWCHRYGWNVVQGISKATVTTGDGKPLVFTGGPTTYNPPTGVYATLTHNGDGTWTLTTKDNIQYRFNSSGALTAIADNTGSTLQCSYDGNGKLINVVDAMGHTLTLGYTGSLLTSVTDFAGHSWSLTYSGTQLVRITDPLLNGQSFSTQFAYNAAGLVSSITDRLNNTWSFAYGQNNNVTQMTDPAGRVTQYAAASLTAAGPGWPTDVVGVGSFTDPTGATASYGHDSASRVVALQGSNFQNAVNSYDASNNLISQQLNEGTWNWTYDASGNLLSETDPLGNTTSTFTYNGMGEPLTRATGPNEVTHYQYDGAGNLILLTDAGGNPWNITRYPIGLPQTKQDPMLAQTHYQYSPTGNLTQVTDTLGNTTQFTYTNELLTQRINARGWVTSYAYDSLGQMTGVSYPTTGNPGITFAYDAEGRITSAIDGTGTMGFTYNSLGQCTAGSDPRGNLAASYDTGGKLLTLTDVSGRVVTYGYDGQLRLTSVGDASGSVQYAFTADSQVASATYSNGTRIEYGYDSAGRLTSIVHRRISDNSVLLGYTATYDANQRVSQIVEQPSGDVTTFQYDNMDRITQEQRTGAQTYLGVYAYNPGGQRVSAQLVTNGVTIHNGTYTYNNAGLLIQVVDSATNTTENYTWNNDGTLASFPGPGYTRVLRFDEERRLTGIYRDYGSGPQMVYEYGYSFDGVMRWRKDYTLGVWTWFSCSLDSSVVEEMVEAQSNLQGTSWQVSVILLQGIGLARCNSDWYHYNFQQSPSLITGPTANIVSNDIYDAFGLLRYQQGSASTFTRAGLFTDEGITFHAPGGSPVIVARDLDL